jgi:tetratricopeptide (TPR) repeat protein
MMNARLEELRSKFQENPRRYFAPYANELRKAGDSAQAISVCRAHLTTQPGHVSGHIVLGQALYEAGSGHEARDVFTAALDLDPENLIALRFLGEIAQVNGEFSTARQWYERLLEADPRNNEVAQLLKDLPTAAPAAPAVAPVQAHAAETTLEEHAEQAQHERESEPIPVPPAPSFHTSFTGPGPAYRTPQELAESSVVETADNWPASESPHDDSVAFVELDSAPPEAPTSPESEPVSTSAWQESSESIEMVDLDSFVPSASEAVSHVDVPDESPEPVGQLTDDSDDFTLAPPEEAPVPSAQAPTDVPAVEFELPDEQHVDEEETFEQPRALFAERGFDGPADDQMGWSLTPSAVQSDPEAAPEDWFDVPAADDPVEVAAEAPPEDQPVAEVPDQATDAWFEEVPGGAVIEATEVSKDDFWLPPDLSQVAASQPAMPDESRNDETAPEFAGAPEAESPTEPMAEFAPEAVEEYAAEPVEEYTPEPVSEYAPEPVAEYALEPVAEYAPEPVAEYTPEPVAEYTPEPVTEYSPEPAEFAPDAVSEYEPGSVPESGFESPAPAEAIAPEPIEAEQFAPDVSGDHTDQPAVAEDRNEVPASEWSDPFAPSYAESQEPVARWDVAPSAEHEPFVASSGIVQPPADESSFAVSGAAPQESPPVDENEFTTASAAPEEPAEETAEESEFAVASASEEITYPEPVVGYTPPLGESAIPVTPAPFVTETLAELYLQQGFREEALSIYRQLVDRDPSDQPLRERLEAIEKGSTPAPTSMPVGSDETRAASQSVRTFFSKLARRPAVSPLSSASHQAENANAPEVPFASAASALANLFSASRPPESDEGAAATLAGAYTDPAGRPSRAADRELSLDHLFRDVPPGGSPSGGMSLDEFYSTPDAAPGSPTEPGEAGGSGESGGGADIRQFTAWLEGLRKK